MTLVKKLIMKIEDKFKIGDIVRISKNKNIFAKGFLPNWFEEKLLWLKMLKTLCCGHMLLVILKTKKLLERFMKKSCKKKKKFRAEEVIRRTGDKLFAKWKGYENSLNSWTDKKRRSIIEWIFSRTEIYRSKCESSIRFI